MTTSRKGFQNGLRVLMVAGSLTGFVSGWAILAHSPKPVSGSAQTVSTQATSAASLPPLDLQALTPSGQAPSQSSPQTSFRQVQPQQSQPLQALPSLPNNSSRSFAAPRLRSRGS